MTIKLEASLVPLKTRLKCKPCGVFYKDDGSISICLNCGKDLKRITVHSLQLKDVVMKISGMEAR